MSARGWHTTPRGAGQMVAVEYYDAGAGCLRRTTDRSDRSVSYAVAEWDEDGGEFAPQNGSLGVDATTWRPIDVDAAREMLRRELDYTDTEAGAVCP